MTGSASVVLNVGGLYWATSQDARSWSEHLARCGLGVVADESVNALSQTALVT